MKKLKLSSFKSNLRRWLNSFKSKICSFDIKPARPILDDLFVLAYASLDSGDNQGGIKHLLRILEIKPRNYFALSKLIEVYLNVGKFTESQRLLKRAFRYYPDNYDFYHQLGYMHSKLGNFRASARAYRYALKLNPDLIVVQHMLSAVEKKTTVAAPREYISKVYNNYASTFERNLVLDLKYCAHIELPIFIASVVKIQQPMASVLDLGCGTGLLGVEFEKQFKPEQIVGVDLSAAMLEKCQAKAIYSELHNADFVEYMQNSGKVYDMIGSTDALIYTGDLTPVFYHAYENLKPGGYFGFSVESLAKGSFKLQPTGRYQHSLKYIQQLKSAFSFSSMYSKLLVLREEHGNPVPGYLVLLQK